MKQLKKILINIVIALWFLVAFFSTICLLSLNEFGTTVLGKNTLLIIDNDELEPRYTEGDLLVVKRKSDSKLEVGNEVFYYNTAMNTKTLVFLGKIEKKDEPARSDVTYHINDEKVSSEYVIGDTDSVKIYHNMGTVLGAITSKWGFLFFILFPMLFAIIYEVMMIIDSGKKTEEQ